MLDGKYLLRDRIGEGGTGSVFLAEERAVGRPVAIKVLHPELARCPQRAQQLRDEAAAARQVRSPHCLMVVDCAVTRDGTAYLVMEHVPGRSLERVIAEESVPLPRIIDLVDQILTALGAAHDAGIVHADVKSDNFLVHATDVGDHVTMIDFGLARPTGSRPCLHLSQGVVMVSGTPEYMAPEVARGKAPTRASDLYGAGVILYELLTGSTPFSGDTAAAVMIRHAYEVPMPPSWRRPDRHVAPALDRVVLRALDKRPDARFADAATFARELRACGKRLARVA